MKNSLLAASTALILALTACQKNQAPNTAAISGGTKATLPFQTNGTTIIGGEPVLDSDPIRDMTALLIDLNQGGLCTASILDSEWLLTAAHCVSDSQASSLLVSFKGNYSDVSSGQASTEDVRKVLEFRVHPRFAETEKKLQEMIEKAQAEGRKITPEEIDGTKDWGDIALVRINGKIPAYKKPAVMLGRNSQLSKSSNVVLAGFGRTAPQQGSSYGELRKVTVQIAEPVWGTSEVLMDQQHDKGACHGDSGGPAYLPVDGKLLLFGVTSRGVGDGDGLHCIHFAAYTNALSYLDWIQEIIAHKL